MSATCAICEEPITRTDVFGVVRCYVAHRACIEAGGKIQPEVKLRRAMAAAESATAGLRDAAAVARQAAEVTRTASAERDQALHDLTIVRAQRAADQRTYANADSVIGVLERELAAERKLRQEAELKVALATAPAVEPVPDPVTPERDATEQRFALLELD